MPLGGRDSAHATVTVNTTEGWIVLPLKTTLGNGGFAVVYASEHSGTSVAVKKRSLPLSDEAQLLLGRIRGRPHDHLCTPLFEGTDKGGAHYQVMPLCTSSLEDMLKVWPLPCPAYPVLAGIASGLNEIHCMAFVHRDVKPGNILMRDGVPLIVDFDEAAKCGTMQDHPAGTWPYVAPECAALALYGLPGHAVQQRPAHPSSDLWSYGVVAHEVIVGRLPCGLHKHPFQAIGPQALSQFVGKPNVDRNALDLAFHRLSTGNIMATEGPLPPGVQKKQRSCLKRTPERRPLAAEMVKLFRSQKDAPDGAPQ